MTNKPVIGGGMILGGIVVLLLVILLPMSFSYLDFYEVRSAANSFRKKQKLYPKFYFSSMVSPGDAQLELSTLITFMLVVVTSLDLILSLKNSTLLPNLLTLIIFQFSLPIT